MTTKSVFIDGAHGTTGLEIRERLSDREDIDMIELEGDQRKDLRARVDAASKADVTIMCLPDEASKELVNELDDDIRVIDTSTANRVSPEWVYGMPELGSSMFYPGMSGSGEQKECSTFRDRIRSSARVANPGCHATGFILITEPLVEYGIIQEDMSLHAFSLTGYSGGGKKMIEEYEMFHGAGSVVSPMQYALSQEHKHLSEMKLYSGLAKTPLFSPVVGDFYEGMELTVGIHGDPGTRDRIKEAYKEKYGEEPLISISEAPEVERLFADELAGTDRVEIIVTGTDDRILITARFDNLGKGASGAAVQNLNIMLGTEETLGLRI